MQLCRGYEEQEGDWMSSEFIRDNTESEWSGELCGPTYQRQS